jgi:hypothetical protein
MSDDRDYIGASEVPAVIGASRFATGLNVWRRKVHGIETPLSPVSRLMCDLGNAAEPHIFAMLQETYPDAERGPPYGTPGLPYKRVRARPDFLLPRAVGDIKLVFETGAQWGTVEDPQIPSDYLPQLLAQAACARANGRTVDEVLLVSLHLDRHVSLQIQRLAMTDDWWQTAEDMIEWVTQWYEACVVTERPPRLRQPIPLHGIPAERLPAREATPEERTLIETLQQLRKQRAFLSLSLEDVQTQLRESMTDTKRLTVDGQRAVTLTEGSASRLDPDLVRAVAPDVAKRCTVVSPTSTLTVTRRDLGNTED